MQNVFVCACFILLKAFVSSFISLLDSSLTMCLQSASCSNVYHAVCINMETVFSGICIRTSAQFNFLFVTSLRIPRFSNWIKGLVERKAKDRN